MDSEEWLLLIQVELIWKPKLRYKLDLYKSFYLDKLWTYFCKTKIWILYNLELVIFRFHRIKNALKCNFEKLSTLS